VTNKIQYREKLVVQVRNTIHDENFSYWENKKKKIEQPKRNRTRL